MKKKNKKVISFSGSTLWILALILAFAVPMAAYGNDTCDEYEGVTMWGSEGCSNGQFGSDLGPRGMATDGTYLYVANYGCQRMDKFTLDGTFQTSFALGYLSDIEYYNGYLYTTYPGGTLMKVNPSNGNVEWEVNISAPGWLLNGVTVDSSGIIHACNGTDHKVYKYNTSGTYQGTWTDSEWTSGPRSIAACGDYLWVEGCDKTKKYNKNGTYAGITINESLNVNALWCDSDGNVYLGFQSSPFLKKYSANGSLIAAWGNEGDGLNQYRCAIMGIVGISNGDTLFVSEGNQCTLRHRRVQKLECGM